MVNCINVRCNQSISENQRVCPYCHTDQFDIAKAEENDPSKRRIRKLPQFLYNFVFLWHVLGLIGATVLTIMGEFGWVGFSIYLVLLLLSFAYSCIVPRFLVLVQDIRDQNRDLTAIVRQFTRSDNSNSKDLPSAWNDINSKYE